MVISKLFDGQSWWVQSRDSRSVSAGRPHSCLNNFRRFKYPCHAVKILIAVAKIPKAIVAMV